MLPPYLARALAKGTVMSCYDFFLLLLLLSFWQFATPSTFVIGFWPNLVSSMYRGWLQKSYTDRGSGVPWDLWGQKRYRCSRTTKLGQKNCWSKLNMMMTFIEVKGHQRSNVVNNVLWQPNLVRRIPDASL